MAIIFSKSSAVNDDLWNEWSKQLVAVMQDTDSEKNNYEEVLNKIFNVKKSKKFALDFCKALFETNVINDSFSSGNVGKSNVVNISAYKGKGSK